MVAQGTRSTSVWRGQRLGSLRWQHWLATRESHSCYWVWARMLSPMVSLRFFFIWNRGTGLSHTRCFIWSLGIACSGLQRFASLESSLFCFFTFVPLLVLERFAFRLYPFRVLSEDFASFWISVFCHGRGHNESAKDWQPILLEFSFVVSLWECFL